MAAVTAGASPAAGRDRRGPVPARTAGAAAAVRSPASARLGRTVRSWPLLVLAAPAAAEVWSGWVGVAEKTGFGQVSPLPGIWPSLHLDTTITLPVGVEAYAAYALRAWLASEHAVSPRTRRFAKWSAICSFLLGMAGQVASHLLADAEATRAPWAITTVVSCLPVLVLGMGGPYWPTCSAPTPPPRTGPGPQTIHRTAGPADRPVPGPRDGPPRTGPQTLRNRSCLRTAPQGHRAGTARMLLTPTRHLRPALDATRVPSPTRPA